MNLPGGYSSRPATLEDIPEVVQLRTAHDLTIDGRTEPHREFYDWYWRRPHIDLPRDSRLVHDREGTLRGLAHVGWDPDSGGASDALGRVHPEHLGSGLGRALLSWTESVTAARQPPPEHMHTTASASDDVAAQLFRSRGFEHVRTSWDMEMRLTRAERQPSLPSGVAVRPFVVGQDEHALHEANQDTFSEHFGHRTQSFESFAADWWGSADFDPTLIWFAEKDGAVAGYVAAFAFRSEGYVASIGVRKPWRGRGVATCLLRQAFAELGARGLPLVSLSVDAGNETGAVELYRKLGMSVRLETLIWEKAVG